jgi:outer membrane protein OmpA-like peptidoglycan-associated protein
MRPSISLLAATFLYFCLAGGARAEDSDAARPGLSRAMRTAIHDYERGEDVQAMDEFMDILTSGEASERSMANEYINLITHRMSGVSSLSDGAARPAAKAAAAKAAFDAPAAQPPKYAPIEEPATPKKPAKAAPREPEQILERGRSAETAIETEAPAGPARAASAQPPREAAKEPPTEQTAANKNLMRKEIKQRLRAAQERSLADLKSLDGVRVAMKDSGDPAAIGIPSSLLFSQGIAFQKDAARVLEPLTKLIFALGSTQVLILPEGTAMGDAKVMDMRRTMGISSTLYQAGVAPPRVRVNLLNTQVDIPKSMTDFKGVVVTFLYDQPMNLAMDSAVGEELGPPISLGIFPAQIRPSRNQGAVIELSVSEPPSGLASWKFQILQPSRESGDLGPLQEVVGAGPVFHQIFWNGRQQYFGDPLPGGRYECVLTAVDGKNRQRTLHKWISVVAEAGEGDRPSATGSANEPASAPNNSPKIPAAARGLAAPSADLPGSASKPLVSGVTPSSPAAKHVAGPKRKVVRHATRAKNAAQEAATTAKAVNASRKKTARRTEPRIESADLTARARPGRYALAFTLNTHQMTAASEKALAKAAGEISSSKTKTFKVVGHASAEENDGEALADRRAKMVAGLLINRYQVDPKKIQISSSSGEGAIVEITLAGR